MSAIQCKACGTHLPGKWSRPCPKCKKPLQIDTPSAPESSSQNASSKSSGLVAATTVGAILVLGAAILYKMLSPPSAEELRSRAVMSALTKCQFTIKSTAQYGDAETPPYTANYGSGDEFYFAWPRGSFHFTNGFGAKLPMSASCIGSISAGEIKGLTINGKDMM